MKEEILSVGANDQVNPDAANGVECNERRSPAARVERLVRPSLSGTFVRPIETDKVAAFKDLFGPAPDRVNDEVEIYFNGEGFSHAMADTLKELGFKVGFISKYRDGSIAIRA